jgi:hypothetical protein
MAVSIEERLARLEEDVERLKSTRAREPLQPWWKRFVGAFENDPLFEDAVNRGREYRQSLRPSEGATGDDGL